MQVVAFTVTWRHVSSDNLICWVCSPRLLHSDMFAIILMWYCELIDRQHVLALYAYLHSVMWLTVFTFLMSDLYTAVTALCTSVCYVLFCFFLCLSCLKNLKDIKENFSLVFNCLCYQLLNIISLWFTMPCNIKAAIQI